MKKENESLDLNLDPGKGEYLEPVTKIVFVKVRRGMCQINPISVSPDSDDSDWS